MTVRGAAPILAALVIAVTAPGAQAATLTTVAGTGVPGASGDGGVATAAQLQAPSQAAPTADGGLLIADERNRVIRRVAPDGTITTVAGTPGVAGSAGDGGPATAAELEQPTGVWPLISGGFLIADRGGTADDGGRIRRVAPDGTITTVAGDGTACVAPAVSGCGDGAPATSAPLTAPSRVLPLPDGGFYVSDEVTGRVWKVGADGVLHRFAGGGTLCAVPTAACGDGGPATAPGAALNAPRGLALGADGSLYVADSGDNRIRRVTPGGTLTTVAGTGTAGAAGEHVDATAADLDGPSGVAVAPDGSLVVADTGNATVRRVDAAGQIATVAGTPGARCDVDLTAPCGDGGAATASGALLHTPADAATAPDGDVLIADRGTHRIRRVDAGYAAPTSAGQRPGKVSVSGNQLLDSATGQPARLLGVNRGAFGDACADGFTTSDGPLNAAAITAMAAWHIDAVRLPINQDCWLGIHGLPMPPDSGTAAEYRDRVVAYAHALEARGLTVILENHYASVPIAGTVSRYGAPLPDGTALPFLSSLAQTFRGDDDVVFDLYNEPHPDSTVDGSIVSGGPAAKCWRDGCVREWTGGPSPVTYTAVGMQAMLDAVRAAGATQPVLVGGLSYASDLTGWLAYRPTDPAGQLVASLHFYEYLPLGLGQRLGAEGRPADDAETPSQAATRRVAAWDAILGPIAAQVPVVAGEIGEYDCDHDFSDQFFAWADAHGVSYLGWTWNATDTQPESPTGTGGDGVDDGHWFCDGRADLGHGGPALITSFDGTPTPFGAGLHDHLAILADTAAPAVTITTPAEGQHVVQGTALAAAFTCADEPGGSGIAGCSGPATVATSVLGPAALTVTATDKAGHTTTRTVSYVVDPVPPVDGGPPPGGGGPPAGGGPPRPAPKPPVVSVSGSLASVAVTAAGRLTVKLRCAGATTCTGTARLTVKAAKKKAKPTTIATAAYSVKAGRTIAVHLKLTAGGRRLLTKARGRLKATLTLTPRTKAAKPVSRAITLKASKRRP